MFESLSKSLQAVVHRLSGRGVLTEKDVDEALREVRTALLGADVAYKVAKDFCARAREKAVGKAVLESVQPGHQVVKVVHDELVALLDAGRIRPVIGGRVPFEELPQALEAMESRSTVGRVVVELAAS